MSPCLLSHGDSYSCPDVSDTIYGVCSDVDGVCCDCDSSALVFCKKHSSYRDNISLPFRPLDVSMSGDERHDNGGICR